MSNKKVAVLQSNYIPWKGYFDIIHDVDLFVFYDEVQYTKNDWRNRNKIKTANGLKWLTLPTGYDLTRKINEVEIKAEIDWQKDHYNKIRAAYKDAPFYNKYKPFLDEIYIERKWKYLSELNQYIIKKICSDYLGIQTSFAESTEFHSEGARSDKLLSLLKDIGTQIYVSGPSARNYLDEEAFASQGIQVIWKDYSGYPDYPQGYPPFEHGVTILDLLFNVGESTPDYIWGFRKK